MGDLDMLPVQSYEEAIPFLRRPYTANLVRGLVINAPESTQAPCTIGLYAIGESLMDRFNLVCGREWGHKFETTVETPIKVRDKTFYYCEVHAIIEVFGVVREDIGEATAETPGQARMNAKAQAWKRTGRWHGPAQCLYSTEDFLIFRGEQPGELRIPKSGDKPHRRPYIDKQCERVIREQYERWLGEEGQGIYGAPLNHQEEFERIIARMHRTTSSSTRASRPARATEQKIQSDRNGNGNGHAPISERPDSTDLPRDTSEETARPAHAAMPDYPAPSPLLKAAEDHGYGEPIARVLSNLARAEGQDTKATEQQIQAVTAWLAALKKAETPEALVMKAATHNARKQMSQESRQAAFARWLVRRAAGDSHAERAQVDDPPRQAKQETEHSPQSSSQRHAELTRAISELRRKMREHGYEDLAVTRFAALATGGGPRTQVNWADVDPARLLILADLLDSAAAIGWTNEQLDCEVIAAHDSSRQASAAGRFSALANRIADLAETRSLQTA